MEKIIRGLMDFIQNFNGIFDLALKYLTGTILGVTLIGMGIVCFVIYVFILWIIKEQISKNNKSKFIRVVLLENIAILIIAIFFLGFKTDVFTILTFYNFTMGMIAKYHYQSKAQEDRKALNIIENELIALNMCDSERFNNVICSLERIKENGGFNKKEEEKLKNLFDESHLYVNKIGDEKRLSELKKCLKESYEYFAIEEYVNLSNNRFSLAWNILYQFYKNEMRPIYDPYIYKVFTKDENPFYESENNKK